MQYHLQTIQVSCVAQSRFDRPIYESIVVNICIYILLSAKNRREPCTPIELGYFYYQ